MEEEREKLQRDLERYHTLLRYTADEAAIAAIKGLIRETRYRLDQLTAYEISRGG